MNEFISDQELHNQELKVDSIHPLRKIYECIMIDGELLSDGEAIDMITNYLQRLNADKL